MNTRKRQLQEVKYGSALYQEALAIRHVVLREPLGLAWTRKELEEEEQGRHFVLRVGEKVVACLVVCPLSARVVKLRQMAVREEAQGQGWGRCLVEGVVAQVHAERYEEVMLHARETATGFYEALGFEKVGEPFEEVGIPHWKMEMVRR